MEIPQCWASAATLGFPQISALLAASEPISCRCVEKQANSSHEFANGIGKNLGLILKLLKGGV
jgi:hypothetical protein